MELKKPLPPAATLDVTANISDIIDKGADKGAIILLDGQSGEVYFIINYFELVECVSNLYLLASSILVVTFYSLSVIEMKNTQNVFST